jgi:hypothetical protein
MATQEERPSPPRSITDESQSTAWANLGTSSSGRTEQGLTDRTSYIDIEGDPLPGFDSRSNIFAENYECGPVLANPSLDDPVEIYSDTCSKSFITACSRFSRTRSTKSTFYTASSTPWPGLAQATVLSYFESLVRDKGLVRSSGQELDWSGRGQFVEFKLGDTVPLISIREIATTSSACIDEVQCRRIRLARKTVLWRGERSPQNVFQEIKHLQSLSHSHIIRFVGAYTQSLTLSILTYPVAECDLASFLDWFSTLDQSATSTKRTGNASKEIWRRSLTQMPCCLIYALAFIHDNAIRHLDMKPKNILVRSLNATDFKVYICDFGISTTIRPGPNTKTEAPTPWTWTYCAPEVYEGDPYSRAADIFSLGCIFAEIYTRQRDLSLDDFAEFRAGLRADGSKKTDPDKSYHANLSRVVEWLQIAFELEPNPTISFELNAVFLEKLEPKFPLATEPHLRITDKGPFLHTTIQMLRLRPEERPNSGELASHTRRLECCTGRAEEFQTNPYQES